MAAMLHGKRILVTQAGEFMGPVLCDVLAGHGAEVIRSTASLVEPGAAAGVVRATGVVDVLVANLAIPAPSTPVSDVPESEWRDVFAALVDPLPRLTRAVLPQMIERGSSAGGATGTRSTCWAKRR